MYFSVIDLQPDRLAAAITITTGRHRAVARYHEFERIEGISLPGSSGSRRVVVVSQAKLPHASGAARKPGMHLGGSDHAAVKLCGSCRNARPSDAFRGETTDTPSALTMADTGPHAALLLTQLAAALAGFLDSHAFLQVVTDPECWEGCKMGFILIASTNPHKAWLRHGFRPGRRRLRPVRGPAA
jgi:hypothetical protein